MHRNGRWHQDNIKKIYKNLSSEIFFVDHGIVGTGIFYVFSGFRSVYRDQNGETTLLGKKIFHIEKISVQKIFLIKSFGKENFR